LVRVSLYVVCGVLETGILGRDGGGGKGKAYLANGLLVRNSVGRRAGLVSRLELVAYERGAERLDHQVVVVQSRNDDIGIDAVEGGGDVGGRHLDRLNLIWRITELAGSIEEVNKVIECWMEVEDDDAG
jgi:hypothetical protein